jgi:heme/copper-type cytochrome/quinol oxidase subunit 3
VLTGLVLLTFVSAGKLSAACVALFWYFAAAVWMGVFAMVYVWTFL